MNNDLLYWIWLSLLPKVSIKKKKYLTDFFEDAVNVWKATGPELRLVPFLTTSNIKNILSKKYRSKAYAALKRAEDDNVRIITIKNKCYPYNLMHIYDPPVVLYLKGKQVIDEKAVAIVGSRKATSYGRNMAEKLAFDLSRFDITVVSGMAKGIDSYAHSGALRAGGRTIAVLGCGTDVVYPMENKNLMEKIIENGTVISEYIPGTEPLPYHFPARNRIISGLSLGVAVIEAGQKSGSLITADYALEQGREVFAVPGNVNHCNSVGTNKLIKEGANLVSGACDIFKEICPENPCDKIKMFKYKNSIKDHMINRLGKNEKKIAELLRYEELHIDILSDRTGIGMKTVNSLLMMMELKGIIEQLPGKIFKLKE